MISEEFKKKANEIVDSALELAKKLNCYSEVAHHSNPEREEKKLGFYKLHESKNVAYLQFIVLNWNEHELNDPIVDNYSSDQLWAMLCDSFRIIGKIESGDVDSKQLEDLIKNHRKSFAELGAKAKLANDKRQDEKKTVRDHWEQWKKFPARYRSKADFARYMLKTCEHLTSQKKIEDWCREWEKEQQQA